MIWIDNLLSNFWSDLKSDVQKFYENIKIKFKQKFVESVGLGMDGLTVE